MNIVKLPKMPDRTSLAEWTCYRLTDDAITSMTATSVTCLLVRLA